MENLLVVEAVLFGYGFAYGFFCGNEDWNKLLRAMCGGLFFALWFISIPLTIWEMRKQ